MDGPNANLFAGMIGLISQADLARVWGYAGPNEAFRTHCRRLGIEPIPGRRGWYDPHAVRQRMNEAQGLQAPPAAANDAPSLVAVRRVRRGEA